MASTVCKLGMYLRADSQVVCTLSLVFIALDRFVAIVFPLRATMIMNVKIRVFFDDVFLWLVPILYVLPYEVKWYNCPFLMDFSSKKVTQNFREPFFLLKFLKR